MEDADNKEGIKSILTSLALNRKEIERMGGSVGPARIFRKGKEIGTAEFIIMKKEESKNEKEI